MVTDNINSKINYFIPGPQQEPDKMVSAEIMQQFHREFKDVFTGIGCFNGTFSLHMKLDSKPYQPPMCSLHITEAIHGINRVATAARHHNTTRHR